jgi:hypothetical protein
LARFRIKNDLPGPCLPRPRGPATRAQRLGPRRPCAVCRVACWRVAVRHGRCCAVCAKKLSCALDAMASFLCWGMGAPGAENWELGEEREKARQWRQLLRLGPRRANGLALCTPRRWARALWSLCNRPGNCKLVRTCPNQTSGASTEEKAAAAALKAGDEAAAAEAKATTAAAGAAAEPVQRRRELRHQQQQEQQQQQQEQQQQQQQQQQ